MATRTPRSRLWRRSLVLGMVLALLTLAAGAALAATRPQSYTAESVLVVLPRANLDDATSAAFYETMSRGQIVGTFAEVANNPGFQRQALDGLGLGPAQRRSVSTAVTVVPDTSVILVRVSARTSPVAEQVADATAKQATTYLSRLSTAYQTQVVYSAAGSATSSGLSPVVLMALAAVVALALGVAAQQAAYHLMMARHGIVGDPEPAPADPGALQSPQPEQAAQTSTAGRRELSPAGQG